MVRHDLKAAGILYQDPVTGKFFDFHSLRVECGTLMARAGVPLTATQHHLGHSTPLLTAKYYTDHDLNSQAAELAKLPRLAPQKPQETSVATSSPPETAVNEPDKTA